MNEDINERVRHLYKTNEYYISIKSDGEPDYEKDYHGRVIDPDGRKRYLLDEQKEWLLGIKEITDFLDKSKPGKLIDVGCGLGWLLSYLDDCFLILHLISSFSVFLFFLKF